MSNRLVAGMVGGGPGAMIGAAHRHAMWLDNQYVLAAGIFGRNPQASRRVRARASASSASTTTTGRWPSTEAGRLDVVAVVTPNDTHFEIAKAFLEAGISVVCEKPLTNDSSTAAELVAIAESSSAILAVPHIYSAYAMVRHAARMVRNGELGRIRFVAAEHASGWASAADRSVADGSRHRWGRQRRRRRRHPRLSSAALHHRTRGHPRFGRAEHARPRTTGVRQRDHAAHAVQRRACHRVGDHGGHRPRARPAHSGVRRRREPGMAPRGSATPDRPRPGRRHDDSRAGHGLVVRRRRPRHACRARASRGIPGGVRQLLQRPRGHVARQRRAANCPSPPAPTASSVSSSSRRPSPRTPTTQRGSALP